MKTNRISGFGSMCLRPLQLGKALLAAPVGFLASAVESLTARVRLHATVVGFVSALAGILAPAGLAGQAAHMGGNGHQLFHTADQCMACHNRISAPSGEDVSIGFDWRSSMMGNAGRDPYWQAAVRREVTDHPAALDAIEDKCTICHLALARTQAVADGGQGRAFENYPWIALPGPYANLAADGVSCTACHQIQDVGLGTEASFTGGYSVDKTVALGARAILGPFDVDDGRTRLMKSASQFVPTMAAHIQSAELCATCHTLYTHALGPDGEEVGRLPEQVPYLEWKHSDYPGERTCQDCHMPVIKGETSVTGVMANPRTGVNRHTFRGGNFLMPRMLNRYRDQLGVVALPQELDATAGQARENLGMRTADLTITPVEAGGGQIALDVDVRNLAGHKLPSAYPSRRTWLRVTVSDGHGRVIFESGALQPNGMITGNDNDEDGSRFEPHYTEISGPDQVQIYEDIMVDYAGEVTTGLIWGKEYVKDNRLLPRGFDKSTAPGDVAVRGAAVGDADFDGGGDRVRYLVDVGAATGPFNVQVELWYQPIGFRWAQNLGEYDTVESARFLGFFNSMAPTSAALVTRNAIQVER